MTEWVTLRDGPTVDVEAIQLAIDLERQGCVMRGVDDRLYVSGGEYSALTEAERASIRKYKPDLMAILAYRAPEP